MAEELRIILTGATGMVGEGVLHECLQHPQVAAVLVIGRKPCGYTHPKLKEILHGDFLNLSPIAEQMKGYNTCMYCLGITSVGMSEADYHRITYEMTLHFADTFIKQNPGSAFCYISAAGTASNEKGSMWARVKGKTENALIKMPFKGVYCFRPGFIKPTQGLKQTHGFYKYINWMYPIGRAISPKWFVTLRELGLAMICAALYGYDKNVPEGDDIAKLATR